jgi:hypothetical protein
MLQDWLKLPPGDRKPVHLKDNISMVVYDSNSGLLFVAYTLENMQPLQIIEALKAITMCLHSAFGGLSEEKACSADPVSLLCDQALISPARAVDVE